VIRENQLRVAGHKHDAKVHVCEVIQGVVCLRRRSRTRTSDGADSDRFRYTQTMSDGSQLVQRMQQREKHLVCVSLPVWQCGSGSVEVEVWKWQCGKMQS
jgi:DNA primase